MNYTLLILFHGLVIYFNHKYKVLKKIILFLNILFLSINYVYALPVWIFIFSLEYIALFWGFLISLIITLSFYLKSLSYLNKILIFINIFIIGWFWFLTYEKIHKDKVIKSYLQDINNVWILNNIDLYYNNNNKGFLKKYNKSISSSEFKHKKNDFYLIDIREPSEVLQNPENFTFQNIRFPDLIYNHKNLLNNINKPILITCIDGERGRTISSFLGNLWYDSYFLEWGLKKSWINYRNKSKPIKNCLDEKGTEVYIWINDYDPFTINIPYMQLTELDVKNQILLYESAKSISKNNQIILLCDKNKKLNCGVGRQSFWILLQKLWYHNICIWE